MCYVIQNGIKGRRYGPLLNAVSPSTKKGAPPGLIETVFIFLLPKGRLLRGWAKRRVPVTDR